MAKNKVFIDPQKIEKLSITRIVAFLQKRGWKQVEHPNKKIFVFEGPLADDGSPLQLILPISHEFEDSTTRLSEAINLLAVVEEKSSNSLIQMISIDKTKLRVSRHSLKKQNTKPKIALT